MIRKHTVDFGLMFVANFPWCLLRITSVEMHALLIWCHLLYHVLFFLLNWFTLMCFEFKDFENLSVGAACLPLRFQGWKDLQALQVPFSSILQLVGGFMEWKLEHLSDWAAVMSTSWYFRPRDVMQCLLILYVFGNLKLGMLPWKIKLS